ncbi:MAG: hypothetical protein II693_04200 [Bacteroidales bacterium]|nr:hypothetical protein [Bacteroidales bacterium]
METKDTEKFKELINRVEALKKELADIEARLAELVSEEAAEPASEPESSDPIDISLDIDEPVVDSVPAPGPVEIEDIPVVEDVPVAEDIPAAEEAPVVEESPAVEDLPSGLFGEPEPAPAESHAHRAKGKGPAVLDAMAGKAAWRTDIPGPEVKSLRSAIALGDQVVFINRLFRKDSALYQDTIDRLNAMDSLSEAMDYLSGTFPEWDLDSDDVYRFMMAVRRRIRK